MTDKVDDLIERMFDACRMIDWDLSQSPKAVTRHAYNGKVEVSWTCTSPRSGMVIAGEYSLDSDTAMQSLIDAIYRYVNTPTMEQERIIALYRSWYYDAVC